MTTRGVLRAALHRAIDWRVLLLFVLVLAVPTLLATAPIGGLLSEWLDFNPRALQWISAVDSLTLTDVIKQLSSPQAQAASHASMQAGVFATVLLAPLLAGIALAASRKYLTLRSLFAGGALYYGRLLRFVPMSLVPLGVFGGAGGLLIMAASKYGDRATTEHAADTAMHLATAGLVMLLLVGQTIADCGRALFVAEPARRSAFFAGFAGWKLFFRRPFRALFLSGLIWLLALIAATALLLGRLRIPQHGVVGVLLALVPAQLAIAALGWGRTARLVALVGLADAHRASRNPPLLVASRPMPPEVKPAVPVAEPAVAHAQPADASTAVIDEPDVETMVVDLEEEPEGV